MKLRNGRRISVVAAGAVIAMVLAACSSGTSATDAGNRTGGSQASSPAGGTGTATPSNSESVDGNATTPSTDDRPELSLNVGYIDTSINGMGIIAVANQEKLWEKAKLKPNLIPFTNGPTSIQAMQSGQLDVAYIGGGAVWLPATGAATIIAPRDISEGDVVLAHPPIKTIADLKGKKIGYPEGGSGEMILDLALEKAGISKDDVELVALDPPSVVTAFVGKQIDAAGIFAPLSDQIMQSAPDTVTLAKDADFPDTVFMGAWVANNDAIKTKADAIERFLEVYIQANDYQINETKQAVEWASKMSGTPVSQLTQQASVSRWTSAEQMLKNNGDGTTFKQYESLEKVFVLMGRMKQVNDATGFVNTDLFGQAMKSLGMG